MADRNRAWTRQYKALCANIDMAAQALNELRKERDAMLAEVAPFQVGEIVEINDRRSRWRRGMVLEVRTGEAHLEKYTYMVAAERMYEPGEYARRGNSYPDRPGMSRPLIRKLK